MINSSFLTKFEIYDFPLHNKITTFFLKIVYCGDMDGCTPTHPRYRWYYCKVGIYGILWQNKIKRIKSRCFVEQDAWSPELTDNSALHEHTDLTIHDPKTAHLLASLSSKDIRYVRRGITNINKISSFLKNQKNQISSKKISVSYPTIQG